jgi:uncharacterized protein (DUF2141 family)
MAAPLVLAAALLSGGPVVAQSEPGVCQADLPRIIVVVEGLRSTRGELLVEIYPDDKDRFLVRGGRVARVREKLTADSPTVCIAAPEPGLYAVVLYHDENADQKFNRNAVGLPREGFGLSNNPAIRLAMPSLKSVRFRVEPGETIIHVRMRYPTGGLLPS